MGLNKIYLDYNATTPVDQRVVDEMLPYFTQNYGNAASVNHAFGWDAEEAVSTAREQVAQLIRVRAKAITFTSGATEAINLALIGFCKANRNRGNHIITCSTEHKAVLDTCKYLESEGFEVTYLPVDTQGRMDLQILKETITNQTILACFMYANNETGVIHPLEEIVKITRHRGITLMSDVTQALGKVKCDFEKLGVDIATFSAHKIYGPKGVGALYISQESNPDIAPTLFGGGHEKKLRPGTMNVPGIVGMGKACELLLSEHDSEIDRLSHLRDKLERELLNVEGLKINGSDTDRIPNTTNLSIENMDGSKLIRSLRKLAVSQGSACSSVTIEPSHVLTAMGIPDTLALSSLRISCGRFTTEEQMDETIEELNEVFDKLRLTVS